MTNAIFSFEDDEVEAEEQLRRMRLSSSQLVLVCAHGLAQYRNTTPFHAKNAPGTLLYQELIPRLREALHPDGWEPAEDGIELVLNTDLALAIVVAAGNALVGDPDRTPDFRYEKGPVTRAAIEGNAGQLGLFDDVPGFAAFIASARPRRVDFDKVQTWCLLHHVDDAHSVMRIELSLPSRLGSDLDAPRWERRIILRPIRFDEAREIVRMGDEPGGIDVDVPVRKKV